MRAVHYSEVETKRFDGGPAMGVDGRVMVGKEDGAKNFCMRCFEIEPQGHTPMHTHDWEHEIFVHAGEGEMCENGSWTPVRPGTAVFIPAGAEHQIRNTGAETLTVICLIPAGPPEL